MSNSKYIKNTNNITSGYPKAPYKATKDNQSAKNHDASKDLIVLKNITGRLKKPVLFTFLMNFIS